MEPMKKNKLFKDEGEFFFGEKGQKLMEIAKSYVGKTTIKTLGYNLKKNICDVTFDYPYRNYEFKTPEELIEICEEVARGNL